MTKLKKLLAMTLCLMLVGGLMCQGAMAKTVCSPKYRSVQWTIVKNTNCVASQKTPACKANQTPATNAGQTPAANTGATSNSLADQVIREVNAERAKAGLSSLRVDAELTRAACVRAAEIVQKFSHTRPDGSAWSTVSSKVYGENIAMGQRTADKVMAAWMSSSGHRENILRASYGSIGVCAYVVNGVTYWVQLFGR